MVGTQPFTIVDSDQTPDRVGGGLPDPGTTSSVTGFADQSLIGADGTRASGPGARYRYEGPLGPIILSHADGPPRTLLAGASVPDASFAIGAPDQTDAVLLKRRLATGIEGRIGDTEVLLIRDPVTRAVQLDLGDGRYELARTGWLPKALLSRPDLSVLASYQIIGRRSHRLIADADAQEVVLAAFLARFAPLVAYRD